VSASERVPLIGRVTAFDRHRGLGVVTDRVGREWSFHSTTIAGGTRDIQTGAAVVFVLVPGHLGRLEARAVTELA